jgi:hypothetical protein
MQNTLLYKFLKYMALTAAIYLIFRFVPNNDIKHTELILITAIIVLVYILIEHLCGLYSDDTSNLTNEQKTAMCSSVCSQNTKLEHLTDINSTSINDAISKVTQLIPTNTPGSNTQESNIKTALIPLPSVKITDLINKVKIPDDEQSKLSSHDSSIVIKKDVTVPVRASVTAKVTPENANVNVTFPHNINGTVNTQPIITNAQVTNLYDPSIVDPTTGVYKPSAYPYTMDDVPRVNSRVQAGVIRDELPYNNDDFNHLPVPDNYNTGSFEYGYSFLPPERWYPTPPHPPVCVTQQRCNVCPSNTTGAPVDVKEWNDARRIMPPDNINVSYVEEKLNSGR